MRASQINHCVYCVDLHGKRLPCSTSGSTPRSNGRRAQDGSQEPLERIEKFGPAMADFADSSLGIDSSGIVRVVEFRNKSDVALAETATNERSIPITSRQFLRGNIPPEKNAHRFRNVFRSVTPLSLYMDDARRRMIFLERQLQLGCDGANIERGDGRQELGQRMMQAG